MSAARTDEARARRFLLDMPASDADVERLADLLAEVRREAADGLRADVERLTADNAKLRAVAEAARAYMSNDESAGTVTARYFALAAALAALAAGVRAAIEAKDGKS